MNPLSFKKRRPSTKKSTDDGKKFIVTFSKMPHTLLEDTSVSDSAVRVYLAFAKYADNDTGLTWVSRETVAELLGRSVKCVKTALTELYAKGWIVSKPRGLNKTAYRYVRYTKSVGKSGRKVPSRDRHDGTGQGPQNQTQELTTTHFESDGANVVPFRQSA